MGPVLACLARRVDDIQNDMLLRTVTAKEMKDALFAMHPDKSPGPDGLSPGFFQTHWSTIGPECVTTVRYSILVEGKEWGPVTPGRGLRQGDLLSPYLFILVAECLSAMLRAREEEGVLQGLRVARGAPAVSHIFFADDCLFLFRANRFEAEVLHDVLIDYGRASGQEVNVGKTSIVFGRNVHREDKEAVCESLGIREQLGHGKYLGLPGYVGRKKREILGFVRERLRERVMHWGNRFLSRGGREVLLKTVLQSIPNYAMNVFLHPNGLSEEIEKIMNFFWWGCERRERGGIRWSQWKDLCVPKQFGGMGFRRVREMNLAMLGKQGWDFLKKPEALGGVRWRVGNRETIRIWGDPWLPDDTKPYVESPPLEYLGNPTVNSLECVNFREWDWEVLYDIFCERNVNLIQSIPLANGCDCDSLYWWGEQNEAYSVRSAYRLAVGNMGDGEGVIWKGLWRLKIPPKVKCFFWNLCTMRLPTKDALVIKRVPCDPICVLCGKANESSIHLFANCDFAHCCWTHLNAAWKMCYADSITVWIEEMWTVLPVKMLEQVVMVTWAIWEVRNGLVWQQKQSDPRAIVHAALLYARNWRGAREADELTVNRALQMPQLEPPSRVPHEVVRLNIDVAMDMNNCQMGFGWSARDSEGRVLGVVMFVQKGLFFVKEAEAMGAREALSWIKAMGWNRVTLETDAQVVTNAVSGGLNLSPFDLII
ncbi:PREDICTED: uncharacterized protein LOC109153925 [Ipomoea nil]|uniref:uncharacterized protein LOC109153925 n=1 Tax=Ipomoea nil TaxID=35883 RepID=UPI000900EABE|nr:PREDICTED: uncharacterized protein LOC109153925 [Ipomoea nil]